jgi:hypothetical protein
MGRNPRRFLGVVVGLTVISSACAGWYGRNIGIFLLTFLYVLPALILVAVVFLLAGVSVKNAPWRLSFLCAAAFILPGSIGIYFVESRLNDYLGFWAWYPGHYRLVDGYTGKDAIVMRWDSWGFAGGGNDSYLVSNPSDSISGVDSATRWAQKYQAGCDVVAVERMQRGLYILTTFNLPA